MLGFFHGEYLSKEVGKIMDLFFELLGTDGVVNGLLEFVIMFLTVHLFYKFRRLSFERDSLVFRNFSYGLLCSLMLFLGPMMLTFSAGFWINDSNIHILSIIQDINYFLFSFLGLFFFYKAANKALKEN